jgi:two-component system phosphate regulon sensor histidine kinase PhoR
MVLLVFMLYFRFRMKYVYDRFQRFYQVLSSSIREMNSKKEYVDNGRMSYGDIENIKELIDSFSQKLKEKTVFLDSVLNNITQGILIIDRDRKILRINESLANLFYLDPGKVKGQKTILVFNNGKLEELIGQVLEEGVPIRKDVIFYSDEDLYLNIEAIPPGPGIANGEDSSKGSSIIMIFDNATQEVEFSRLRSQFAANVSHEMRTPLTSIKGYIETVADSELNDKKMVQDYLGKSLEEVEKLNFLIKDVLDLSKIEYRRNVLFQEDNDLVAIIKEVIGSLDFLAKKNGVSINFTHSESSIPFNTDEELFRQLVRNIVENSIFYSGKGSKVEISLEEREDHILLEFIDNGIGIKKEDLPFIFQRFYRGKPDISLRRIGSGLGLSIVKHTVDLHGGDIKVESMPGVRTRFSITLPKENKKP